MLENISNNKEKYFSPELILKKKIRVLSDNEILKIDQSYRLSVFFQIKRRIKILLNYLFSLILKKNINLVTSRNLNKVKKKYDNIAGSYIENFQKEDSKFLIQYKNEVLECSGSIKQYHAYCLSNIIQNLNLKTILEVGAGELTQYFLIKKDLDKKSYKIERSCGLDLSLKRLEVGKEFLNSENQEIEIYQGDAQKMPFKDNEFDILYTSHCLEQVPHLLETCLKEMLRVSKKYIVLVEPSYEFTNKTTRNHIFRKNYIKINNKVLTKILKDINYKRFKLPIFTYVNGSELIIIEKN